jgi:hypothetical protein
MKPSTVAAKPLALISRRRDSAAQQDHPASIIAATANLKTTPVEERQHMVEFMRIPPKSRLMAKSTTRYRLNKA